MIEADLLISFFLQRVGDRGGLLEPFQAVRQNAFRDLALVLLERRDMGVAEHRETIRSKPDAAPDGVEAGGNGLMRQPVDQVEVDPGDAGSPQAGHSLCRLLETLHPIDGTLYDRIETLHAEARAVDTAKPERLEHGRRERARIDLDGDLGRGKHEVGVPDRADQVHEEFGRHDRRRSAAEVDMLDLDAPSDLP